MKIRIVLVNNSHIEFEAPEGFIFNAWAQSVKALGGWFTDGVYVPADKILFAALDTAREQVKFEGKFQ